MSETCKRCGRTTDPNHAERAVEWCNGSEDPECAAIAAAYRRGILRGVAVAKSSARLTSDYYPKINWTDVDREATKLAGEVDHGDA